jgi:L-rhamnose mutarotase
MTVVRAAWRLRIRPGMEEEYRRRHREVWPEVVASIRARGVRSFSIFMDGDEVFLYAETDLEAGAPDPELEPVGSRWQEYMSDILIRDLDPATGRPRVLEEVFHVGPADPVG